MSSPLVGTFRRQKRTRGPGRHVGRCMSVPHQPFSRMACSGTCWQHRGPALLVQGAPLPTHGLRFFGQHPRPGLACLARHGSPAACKDRQQPHPQCSRAGLLAAREVRLYAASQCLCDVNLAHSNSASCSESTGGRRCAYTRDCPWRWWRGTIVERFSLLIEAASRHPIILITTRRIRSPRRPSIGTRFRAIPAGTHRRTRQRPAANNTNQHRRAPGL